MRTPWFHVEVTIGRGVHSKRKRQRKKSRRGPTPEVRDWLRAVEQKMVEHLTQEAVQNWFVDQALYGSGVVEVFAEGSVRHVPFQGEFV